MIHRSTTVFIFRLRALPSVTSATDVHPLAVPERFHVKRFLIPLGMALGAGVTVPQFLVANLLPVTLGNIVGGAVAVCGLYSGSFGSLFAKNKKA